jgi:hypothetical protein
MCFAFIRFEFWFQTEPDGSEGELEFHRTNPEGAAWFVALAKEQLALIAKNGLHGIPFIMGLKLVKGVGNAPTSAHADPVFETGAASLYLPAFQKMAARLGLAPRQAA